MKFGHLVKSDKTHLLNSILEKLSLHTVSYPHKFSIYCAFQWSRQSNGDNPRENSIENTSKVHVSLKLQTVFCFIYFSLTEMLPYIA